MKMLEHAREASRMDLGPTEQSCMSADLAFADAYQRMGPEETVEIAKALAVRISTLLDSQKQGVAATERPSSYAFGNRDQPASVPPATSSRVPWEQELGRVSDLIKVRGRWITYFEL
jgi:hypothetical protein